MKRNLILVFLIAVFSVGCSAQPGSPSEFPLEKGTTWIYSFETYEPSEPNPSQIVKATYRLTATVAETEIKPPYFIAHITFKYDLLSSDSGWRGWGVDGQPTETWYLVKGGQVFETSTIDKEDIDIEHTLLAYVFPLTDNKSWCLFQNMSCESVGWRIVANQSTNETPAGKFDDCYDMRDIFNGGGLFQTFCIGVGIVSMKHDHAGTRYGFKQTLIDYSIGVP